MNKIKVLVVGSGSNADRFVNDNTNNLFINIIGRLPDGAFTEKWCDQNENLLTDSDLVFLLGYSRIIPSGICNENFIVNLHAGILPKWRGFSANAWAIMNGEKYIGYSLHKVTDKLDAGILYYVKRILLDDEDTYADVHWKMIDSIIKECPEILFKIANSEIVGEKQNCTGIAYCTKFHSSMGELVGFNKEAQYYVNLYKCMAKPLGSGLYFYHKNQKYDIGKIEHGNKYGCIDYLCCEGKIVNIDNDSLWIKVKDSVIICSQIESAGRTIRPDEFFKNGQQL